MLKGAAARRYAQAVFELAVQHGELDEWLEDLRLMSAVLGEPRMALFLEHPKIPFDAKKEVIDRSMGQLLKLRLNLVYVLIAKRRTEIVRHIAAEYESLYDEYRGIAHAEVTTAVPLSESETKAVAERLSQFSGKKNVTLRTTVDDSIIGGIVARVGDRLIDASVKGRLSTLRARLMERAI